MRLSGVCGHTSTIWTGLAPTGEGTARCSITAVAMPSGRPAVTRSELCGASSSLPTPRRSASSRKTSRSGAIRRRLDHRLHELQVIGAVALRDVVVLEERRRGQDDVGEARRVGHHLVEDDREQILALRGPRARDSDRASSRADCSCRRTAPTRAGPRTRSAPGQADSCSRRASAAPGTSISVRPSMPHAAELLIV